MKFAYTSIAALTVAAAATLPGIAHATDGTITINGTIGTQTCTINGNGTGSTDFTVKLPKVSTTALASGGSTAGRTPFTIGLTNCSPETGDIYAYFETGPTVNSTTGQLLNSGSAENVEVGLLNGDTTNIGVGKADHKSKSVKLVNGAAVLPYYAQYVATGGAAGQGSVNTSVMYSIMYQ